MKKYIVLFVIILQFLNINYLISQELEIKIPIVNLEFTGEYDSTVICKVNYIKSVSYAIMDNYWSERTLNNERITANILRSGDTLSIFNIATKRINSVVVPNSFYIEHVYFHNYDSIFLFFDREFVYSNHLNEQKMADFYMTDTTGVIKGLFSLDSVPFIYNGDIDTMIYIRKLRFEDVKIINNVFYIPFAIYRPSISDTSLRDLNMKLLCAFDLNLKKVKMLNIKIPDKYIGEKFCKNASTNGFDYYILNDSILIYSFDCSTEIYSFNIQTDSSILIKSFPDFYFNNILNPSSDCFGNRIGRIKYSQKENLYIRQFDINKYENFKDFHFTQILDENFNLIGYFVEDSMYEYMDVNANGDLVVLNKTEEYRGYKVKIGEIKLVSLDELKETKINFKKKTESNKTVAIDKNIPQEERIGKYIASMNIPINSKVVIFSVDNCGHVLDYLFQNMTEIKENDPIYYLIYAENSEMIYQFLELFKVPLNDHIIIDTTNNYKSFIEKEIQSDVLLVKNKKKSTKVIKSKHNTLLNDYTKFIK